MDINWFTTILLIIAIILSFIFFYTRREMRKNIIMLTEEEFTNNMRKGQLIDLRKKNEFDDGHINGARNIPATLITKGTGKLRNDLPVYLYCKNGKASKRAAVFLSTRGFTTIFGLESGLENWSKPLKNKQK